MTQLDPSLHTQVRATGSSGSEVPFDDREILYSRTDSRGVIEEGNGAFERISGYDWGELKGAPHKLIRHPDMPKGLFQLYWEFLKDGKRIGAYVKNKAKDGRYYWVYAVVWPVETGFISLRIKPHSEMFTKSKELYAELLEEEANGMTPKRSAELLLERIGELGYSKYENFMSDALSAEIVERGRHAELPEEQSITRFIAMSKTLADIRHETADLMESFKAIRAVPMNMRIIASRLENSGGPISAISVNYGSMLDEMATWVKDFIDGDKSTYGLISKAVMEGQFLAGLQYLQKQLASDLINSTASAVENNGLDKEGLEKDARQFREETMNSLKSVEIEAARLSRSVLDMKRYVTGLSSTRMMCKIESATLNQSGDSLVGIVEQLDTCQDEIEDRLAKIVELNMAIQSNTSMLRAIQAQ